MVSESLNNIDINKSAIVSKVLSGEDIKRRFLDIGITDGTEIIKILESYDKSICAYHIRGALIAIRNEDAKDIIVEVASDE